MSASALRVRTTIWPKVAPPAVRSSFETTVEPATLPKLSTPAVSNCPGAETMTLPVLPRVTAPLPVTMLPAGMT